MKRILIALVLGVALLSMLCVGLVLGLAFTPVRAQVARAIDRAAERANIDMGPRGLDETNRLPFAQGESEAGILIAGVLPDSPAAQAGLRRADLLMEVNDQAVNSLPDLMQVLSDANAGDEVRLTVQRGGETLTLTATAPASGSLQPEFGPMHGGMLGIIPCTDSEMLRGFQFGPQIIPQSRAGAQIAEVTTGSPAESAGLQPEEWIVAVNGEEVANASDLVNRVRQSQPGDPLTLTVENASGENREVTVTLTENPDAEQPDQAWLGVRLGSTVERQMPNRPANPNPNAPPLPDMPALPAGFERGAVVTNVVAEGPAAQAGLETGQIILAINGDNLTTADQLKASIAALSPGDEVTLTVIGPGDQETRDVVVSLGENPNQAGAAYLGIRFGFMQVAPESIPSEPEN